MYSPEYDEVEKCMEDLEDYISQVKEIKKGSLSDDEHVLVLYELMGLTAAEIYERFDARLPEKTLNELINALEKLENFEIIKKNDERISEYFKQFRAKE